MTLHPNNQISQKVDAAIAEYLEIAEQGVLPDRAAFLARHVEIAEHLKEFLADYGATKLASSDRANNQIGPNDFLVRPPPGKSAGADMPRGQPNNIIIAVCPGGHPLRIPVALAGQRAKCPKCEAAFVVPNPVANAAPDQRQQTPREVTERHDTLSFKTPSAGDTSVPTAAGLTGKSSSLSAIGSRFGQFELIELLGEGGFGAVYRAHDVQLDRDVALKLPRPGPWGIAKK